MGGRKKLNVLHIKFALMLAAAAGVATGSWLVFVLALGVALGLAFYGRDIR